MVGETWDNWKQCVAKTIDLAPDSVTIYQMELPFNTVFSQELKVIGQDEPFPGGGVADWPTKRAWVDYAFDEMGKAGYETSSAYTLVKDKAKCRFVYRDSLWHGADMFGTGVASFGHVHGVHIQNVDTWEQYVDMLDRGELPLGRALPVNRHELLIREMILQLKTGRLEAGYFRRKFGSDILEDFADGFAQLEGDGFLTRTPDGVELTREGLLQIDRRLPAFFEPQYPEHAVYLGTWRAGSVSDRSWFQRLHCPSGRLRSRLAITDGSYVRRPDLSDGQVPGRAAGRTALRAQPHVGAAGGRPLALRLHLLRRPPDAGRLLPRLAGQCRRPRGIAATDRPHRNVEGRVRPVRPGRRRASSPSTRRCWTIRRRSTWTITAPAGCSRWNRRATGLVSAQEYHQFLADNWEKTQRLIKGKINTED